MRSARQVAVEVLETEAAAVQGLIPQLDERFDKAVELLRACSAKPAEIVTAGSAAARRPARRPAGRYVRSIRAPPLDGAGSWGWAPDATNVAVVRVRGGNPATRA